MTTQISLAAAARTVNCTPKKEISKSLQDFLNIASITIDYKNKPAIKKKLYKLYQTMIANHTPISQYFFVLKPVTIKGEEQVSVIYTVQYYNYCFQKATKQQYLLHCESFTKHEIEQFKIANPHGFPITHQDCGIKDPVHTVDNMEVIVCALIDKITGKYIRPIIYTHKELYIRWNKRKTSEVGAELTPADKEFVKKNYSHHYHRITDYQEMIKKVAIKNYIKGYIAATVGENEIMNHFSQSLELDEEVFKAI